jgi:excisionase family DNA binding protein
MTPADPSSPWLTAEQAGEYLQRGRRFILREIKSGRMRGAVVSGRGRGEVLTRREWLDAWVDDHAKPLALRVRQRL